MKILVVSDTHGAVFESIFEPLKREKGIDFIIHCGDKYKDVEKLSDMIGVKNFYRVTGNCDYNIKDGQNTLEIDIEEKHFLVTHGHLLNVKDGLESLKLTAKRKKADVVLFGHTHIAHNEMDGDILYFNPGSTILPKTGKSSYGIIEINTNNLKSKIVNL